MMGRQAGPQPISGCGGVLGRLCCGMPPVLTAFSPASGLTPDSQTQQSRPEVVSSLPAAVPKARAGSAGPSLPAL